METSALESAIAAMKQGDPEMFSVVVECCHVRVRTYISALVHDPHDADDLAQQTFVYAYQHIHEYTIGTHFLGWLKAIAYNHVRDFWAQSTRRIDLKRCLREEILQQVQQAVPVEGIDPRIDALSDCVESLPENQRSFLKTICSRTESLEDVARNLNRSGAAVRKNISRLYDQLRNCIQRKIATEAGL